MARYCLDTSGLSNPLEYMPEDIHATLWQRIASSVSSGVFAVTTEIYDELALLRGPIGVCINSHRDSLRFEVGDQKWNWQLYLDHTNRMLRDYRAYISEYNGNRKGTIGINDMSIIALGRTPGLPVISMETLIREPQAKRQRIPNICMMENVQHLTFSDFLRMEGIKL
ncbi:MAG: DUF4411 family protein [Acetobacteraceae bacterium]|jgi:hypothetical protein